MMIDTKPTDAQSEEREDGGEPVIIYETEDSPNPGPSSWLRGYPEDVPQPLAPKPPDSPESGGGLSDVAMPVKLPESEVVERLKESADTFRRLLRSKTAANIQPKAAGEIADVEEDALSADSEG